LAHDSSSCVLEQFDCIKRLIVLSSRSQTDAANASVMGRCVHALEAMSRAAAEAMRSERR
jgi:hypothetical protein